MTASQSFLHERHSAWKALVGGTLIGVHQIYSARETLVQCTMEEPHIAHSYLEEVAQGQYLFNTRFIPLKNNKPWTNCEGTFSTRTTATMSDKRSLPTCSALFYQIWRLHAKDKQTVASASPHHPPDEGAQKGLMSSATWSIYSNNSESTCRRPMPPMAMRTHKWWKLLCISLGHEENPYKWFKLAEQGAQRHHAFQAQSLAIRLLILHQPKTTP